MSTRWPGDVSAMEGGGQGLPPETRCLRTAIQSAARDAGRF